MLKIIRKLRPSGWFLCAVSFHKLYTLWVAEIETGSLGDYTRTNCCMFDCIVRENNANHVQYIECSVFFSLVVGYRVRSICTTKPDAFFLRTLGTHKNECTDIRKQTFPIVHIRHCDAMHPADRNELAKICVGLKNSLPGTANKTKH